jgi:catechol 2,3-dioxygenase-like lactoylglutathione lyase family enzyme
MITAAAMFGSNDIEKAKQFYDAVLGAIGLGTMMEHGSGGRIYGTMSSPVLSVVRPYDGGPATVGNGSMATLNCESREQVRAIHAKALELGGRDEGAPGPRAGEESGVYAAYFRDLDGNKICAVHFAPVSVAAE